MKRLALAIVALCLISGLAYAQISPFRDPATDTAADFYLPTNPNPPSPGGTFQFGPLLQPATVAGAYNIPACNSPPPAAAGVDSPQADMWVVDQTGTGLITLTCAARASDGVVGNISGAQFGQTIGGPTYSFTFPGQAVHLHWTGTNVVILGTSNNPLVPELIYRNINALGGGTTVATTQLVGDTTLSVPSSTTGFPSVVTFQILIGSEIETVTANPTTPTWTVTRGANGTTAAQHNAGSPVQQAGTTTAISGSITSGSTTVTVTNASNFPSSGTIVISMAGSLNTPGEYTTITSGLGTTTWTFGARGVLGTSAAAHSGLVTLIPQSAILNNGGGVGIGDTTVTVASTANLPATPFLAQMDSEHVVVTGIASLVLTITRAANGTTAATHADGIPLIGLPVGCATLPIAATLTSMRLTNPSGNEVVGGVDAGTAIGLSDILVGATLLAVDSTPVDGINMLQRFLSTSAAAQVCLQPHTTWNGAYVTARVMYAQ